MPAEDIPVVDLTIDKVTATHIRYFTGGLIALPVDNNSYVLGPVHSSGDGFGYFGPFSFEETCKIVLQSGCFYVGCNQILSSSEPERSEFWYPNIGNNGATEQSSDSWAAVAFQAREAGDDRSSEIARHISISVASASRRLRDVAFLLNEQLQWAVIKRRASGNRYSNNAIHDLYLAIHSLLSEMCSARDYLCLMAAKRVMAKQGVDNLARLEVWLSKGANASSREDPLIKLLLEATGSKADPGWLHKLSDLRNQITHRQPLGANPEAAALLYQQVATSVGLVSKVRLAKFKKGQDVADGEDPFVSLLRYWLELEKLSKASLPYASYPPEHPRFIVKR